MSMGAAKRNRRHLRLPARKESGAVGYLVLMASTAPSDEVRQAYMHYLVNELGRPDRCVRVTA